MKTWVRRRASFRILGSCVALQPFISVQFHDDIVDVLVLRRRQEARPPAAPPGEEYARASRREKRVGPEDVQSLLSAAQSRG